MRREDILVAALAATSVVLVVLIVLTTSGGSPALAQGADRSNGFVMLTARFDERADAMMLIDERSAQIATFLYVRGTRDVVLSDLRDLRADFNLPLQPLTPPERPTKPEKPEK